MNLFIIKVKKLGSMINTLFSGGEIPKERIHVRIPSIFIDSVLQGDKKNYPQVFLEQCKYKMKKGELISFIDDEVDLSSDDDSDNDSLNSLGGLLIK